MRVGAAVLAAGAGRRFDATASEHKLLAPCRGRPLVAWALGSALAAGMERTWVVTGAVDLGEALVPGLEVLANPAWEEGLATSLQVAVDAARRAGLDAIVVGLADQPGVTPEAWRAVASGEAPIVVATYAGVRGNPVCLAREVWGLLPAEGDIGARALMCEHPSLVAGIACGGQPDDIDTREDLDRWNSPTIST